MASIIARASLSTCSLWVRADGGLVLVVALRSAMRADATRPEAVGGVDRLRVFRADCNSTLGVCYWQFFAPDAGLRQKIRRRQGQSILRSVSARSLRSRACSCSVA